MVRTARTRQQEVSSGQEQFNLRPATQQGRTVNNDRRQYL